jgi:hypothetical protein
MLLNGVVFALRTAAKARMYAASSLADQFCQIVIFGCAIIFRQAVTDCNPVFTHRTSLEDATMMLYDDDPDQKDKDLAS